MPLGGLERIELTNGGISLRRRGPSDRRRSAVAESEIEPVPPVAALAVGECELESDGTVGDVGGEVVGELSGDCSGESPPHDLDMTLGGVVVPLLVWLLLLELVEDELGGSEMHGGADDSSDAPLAWKPDADDVDVDVEVYDDGIDDSNDDVELLWLLKLLDVKFNELNITLLDAVDDDVEVDDAVEFERSIMDVTRALGEPDNDGAAAVHTVLLRFMFDSDTGAVLSPMVMARVFKVGSCACACGGGTGVGVGVDGGGCAAEPAAPDATTGSGDVDAADAGRAEPLVARGESVAMVYDSRQPQAAAAAAAAMCVWHSSPQQRTPTPLRSARDQIDVALLCTMRTT